MRSGIQEEVSVELQHINVKLLLNNAEELDLDPLIPVFHSWIQQQVCEELLLDVADYRHVQGGPGIILIGHEADYSLDNTDNRLGVRYNRKAVLDGGKEHRLVQATRAALQASQRLEEDSTLNQKLKLNFNGQEIEIFVNDRALAPNREDIRQALKPDFQAFADRLFGAGEYSLSFDSDPRRLLTVSLKASRAFAVQELLQNLAS
jgi:hypothetical protein